MVTLDGPALLTLGNDSVDVLPHVERAIGTFGHVHLQAARWLAFEIVKYAGYPLGRAIRESGTRMTRAEHQAHGLPKWSGHLSHEVWEILTAEGRRDPIRCFDTTAAQALKGARNELQRARALRSRRMFAGAVISLIPERPACPEAETLFGRLLGDYPLLPLASCRQECLCGWRQITRSEASRLGLV